MSAQIDFSFPRPVMCKW